MQGVQSNGRLGVAQANGELELGSLGRALWAKKWRIVLLTMIAAGVAFSIVNVLTPRYRSEARLLIETRENIFLRPDAEKNAVERGATVDQEAVTSQVQLILSRDLASIIIKKLKLAELPEFDPVLRGPSLLRSVLSLTGIIKDPMSMTPEERVLKSYFDRLQAFQVEKSRVIAIEFEFRGRRTRRARRQRDRRRLSGAAAGGQAGSDPRRRLLARRRDREPAQEGRRRRGQGRARTAPRPTCSSATTTPRCRTSSSAILTPSWRRRGRRNPTRRRRRR